MHTLSNTGVQEHFCAKFVLRAAKYLHLHLILGICLHLLTFICKLIITWECFLCFINYLKSLRLLTQSNHRINLADITFSKRFVQLYSLLSIFQRFIVLTSLIINISTVGKQYVIARLNLNSRSICGDSCVIISSLNSCVSLLFQLLYGHYIRFI